MNRVFVQISGKLLNGESAQTQFDVSPVGARHRKSPSARRTITSIGIGFLLVGLGLTTVAGCATEEPKPRTVTEWMKQPRVGDLNR